MRSRLQLRNISLHTFIVKLFVTSTQPHQRRILKLNILIVFGATRIIYRNITSLLVSGNCVKTTEIKECIYAATFRHAAIMLAELNKNSFRIISSTHNDLGMIRAR